MKSISEYFNREGIPKSTSLKIIIALIIVIIIAPKFGQVLEYNQPGYTQTKQAWWTGDLSVRTDPGLYAQLFGKIWTFKKESTYKFTDKSDEEAVDTPGISIRFSDGGRCSVWGSIRFTLPEDDENVKKIIRRYMGTGGDPFEDFFRECVQQVVRKSVVVTGALITTEQSYTTHRAQFSQMAWDQIVNGVYQIETIEERVLDPIRETWTVERFAKIVTDPDGQPVRESSYFKELGVSLSQFAISQFNYEAEIKKLIVESRDYQTKIQTAEADAMKARQEKITAEETGKRDVTEAEYKAREGKTVAVAEVEKDRKKALVDAKRDLSVAQQDYLAVVENVKGMKALADGQAERRKMVLAADGALVRKKAAYEKVMAYWGGALKKLDLVPTITVASDNATTNQLPPSYLIFQQIDAVVRNDLGLMWTFPKK